MLFHAAKLYLSISLSDNDTCNSGVGSSGAEGVRSYFFTEKSRSSATDVNSGCQVYDLDSKDQKSFPDLHNLSGENMSDARYHRKTFKSLMV